MLYYLLLSVDVVLRIFLELFSLDVSLEMYCTAPGRMQRVCGSCIRWLVSRIRSCVDKLGGGWERDQVQRTAKRYDDEGRGIGAGLRLLLHAAVIVGAKMLPPQTNRQTSNDKKRRGAVRNTHSSTSCNDPELHCVHTIVMCRMQVVGSVLSLSAQYHLNMENSYIAHPLAVLLHLRPRFAYILDLYGHARSRRRALARRGEIPLYCVRIDLSEEWWVLRELNMIEPIKLQNVIFSNIMDRGHPRGQPSLRSLTTAGLRQRQEPPRQAGTIPAGLSVRQLRSE